MTTYEPRKGATADRAIELLKGEEKQFLTATKLADQLDVALTALYPCMEIPVKHGLVAKFKVKSEVCYGMPGSEPAPRSEPVWVPPAGHVTEEVVKEALAGLEGQKPPDLAELWKISERRGTKPALKFEDAPQDDFAVAVFSDGRFLLEFQGQTITLPKPYTDRLVKYLERMAEST